MLFAEDDAPHLRSWIIKRLEDTSDADADVLADYVIALLRHDADVDTIRKLFEEEIPDFLREDSASFTDDVFQAIKHKSYLPGAPPAPPVPRQAAAPTTQPQPPKIPSGPAALQKAPFQPHTQHTPYAETPTAFGSHSFRNGSKKRSYRDLDAPEPQAMNWDYGGDFHQQQPYKQARRGGGFGARGGRFDDHSSRGRGGLGGGLPNSAANGVPGPEFNPQQMFDANAIMENIRQLQELGAQMGLHLPQNNSLPKPAYSGQTLPASSRQRRKQCREYERKGFCSRGTKCHYEHGNSSAFMPAFQPPAAEEYDPNNAAIGMFEHPGQPIKPMDMGFMQMPQPVRKEPKKPKRKATRPAIAAEGPSHDKKNTQLVVENIPEENYTEDAVREFFGQFGSVQNIDLRVDTGIQKRIALVKFDNWASANAAWKSPKVVFDNRFVKVYWYKDESQFAEDTRQPANYNGYSNYNDTTISEEPEFDLNEFNRKQEEAQKIYLEKQQKHAELDRQREELEEKQKDLIARQLEAKRELKAKLAASDRDESLSPILSKTTIDGEQPSQAEALRAKLAALEEEANSLGLDPDQNDDSYSWVPGSRGGRRPYRARGGYQPRVWRGSYRGRGGGGTQDVHAAYAAYSLDNRPKIVVVSGVDFTDSDKDEALKQYLFGIGEFTDISTDPSATHITFKDRKTAEQFMFGVSGPKTIPGVEGEVEVSWASSAPKNTKTDTDLSGTRGEEDMASGQEEVEDENGFDRAGARSQYDMDYEAGEWEAS